MDDDELGTLLIGCSMQVHTVLGPGLLENVYEACLCHELKKSCLEAKRQVPIRIRYDGIDFDEGFRIDILLSGRIVVELKVAERLMPVHSAQVLTYLKLTGLRVGYLLNFNSVHMRAGGIKRLING
jgi:GxxExxY protein